MSAVKFECPSCGQHMECDRARSGDVIHCVGCCAELRIPFSSSKTGLATVERAELIIPGAAPSAPAPSAPASSAPITKPPSIEAVGSTEKPSDQSIEATCPVCQSHLRLDPLKCSTSENSPPAAELVHRNEAHAHPKDHPHANQQPQPQPSSHKDTCETHHLSFEERERQIAEGRKAHPIQLYPAQKPRLDYIRSGGTSPPGKGEPPHPDSFSE